MTRPTLPNVEAPRPRRGMPSPRMSEEEFKRRYRQHFFDPAFVAARSEIDRIVEIAWDAYYNSRKSPVTRKAGPEFADPDYDLSVEWLAARQAIHEARDRYQDPARRPSVLIVNGSSRSEHICPGEMSKSYRLAEIARAAIEAEFGLPARVLDLSRLASEYGREIHPCKACFSTAAALCRAPSRSGCPISTS